MPPPEFRNNEKIRVTFTVEDQWGLEHSAKLRMWLQRSPAVVNKIQTSTRRRLFDHPDNDPK